MRLPLVPQIDSRDGTDDKDCLHKNLLIEQDNQAQLASVRPGLRTVANNTGDGRGIVDFQGELLSIYGASLAVADIPSFIGDGLQDRNRLNTGEIPIQSFAWYITPSGKVVVGSYKLVAGQKIRPFRWSKDVGMEFLGGLGGTSTNSDRAVFCTDDGLTVIGTAANGSNVQVPFKWVDGVGMSAIPGFSALTAIYCANRECTVFAGVTGGQQYVWTESGGVSVFTYGGIFEAVYDVSDSGDVVGFSFISGVSSAVKRSANGAVTVLTTGPGSSAFCCSSDGSVIFGSGSIAGHPTPFKYENGVYTTLNPSERGAVVRCTPDGNWAFGWARKDGANIFFRWGRTTGFEYLDTLSELGGVVSVQNIDSYSISDDGKTCASVCEDPLSGYLIHFVWDEEFGFVDIENGLGTQSDSTGLGPYLSGDGNWVATNLLTSYPDYTFYTWSRDTGQFRTVATLDDDFFDFVESV